MEPIPDAATEHERVQTETLKLLVQLAWSDGSLGPTEIGILGRLARDSGAAPSFVDALPVYLAGDVPIPPPDLGLLKRYRHGVLALADLLLHADGVHCDREQQVRDELAHLLD